MSVVTVSRRGQIVIPKRIMEALQRREGGKLLVELEDERIVLRRLKEPGESWRQLQGSVKGVDLLAALEQEHSKEIEIR